MLLMGIPSWNEAMKLPAAQRLEAFADPAYASVLVADMERSLRPGNAARDALGRDGRGAPSDSDAEEEQGAASANEAKETSSAPVNVGVGGITREAFAQP